MKINKPTEEKTNRHHVARPAGGLVRGCGDEPGRLGDLRRVPVAVPGGRGHGQAAPHASRPLFVAPCLSDQRVTELRSRARDQRRAGPHARATPACGVDPPCAPPTFEAVRGAPYSSRAAAYPYAPPRPACVHIEDTHIIHYHAQVNISLYRTSIHHTPIHTCTHPYTPIHTHALPYTPMHSHITHVHPYTLIYLYVHMHLHTSSHTFNAIPMALLIIKRCATL